MTKHWGEIEAPPAGCRWGFPFGKMQPGDTFRVDQLAKTKGQMANQAYVAGHRLDKKFSVTDDPEHPGFTLVRCRDVENEQVAVRTAFAYEEATKLFERFYDPTDVEHLRQYAGILQQGEYTSVEASWLSEPSIKAFIVTTSFNPDRTLVVLKPGVVEIIGKGPDFRLEEWQREQLLAD